MLTMGSAVTTVSESSGRQSHDRFSVRFTKPVIIPYKGGADFVVERVVKASTPTRTGPPSS